MKITIWFEIDGNLIKGINLGTVEKYETKNSTIFTRIVYAQNRLIYLTSEYNKETITVTTTNIEIISQYIVMPELDKIL